VKAFATREQLGSFIQQTGIRWYILHPGDSLGWPADALAQPAFVSEGFRVYDLHSLGFAAASRGSALSCLVFGLSRRDGSRELLDFAAGRAFDAIGDVRNLAKSTSGGREHNQKPDVTPLSR
jgi:hypothetical protein